MNNLLYLQWALEFFMKVILPIGAFVLLMLLAYNLGQKSIIDQYEEYARRKREREARWQEFEEED
jgi:uncharacterized protein YdaU (DUF1376 family)